MARRTSKRRLAVWCNGARVGLWESNGSSSAVFTYDSDWLANPQAVPLSITMPLTPGASYRGAVVDAYFNNLLPDNRDILMRLQAKFGTASDSAADLLAEIGRDCVGAIQIAPEGEAPPDIERIDGVPLSESDVEAILDGVTVIRGPGQDDDFRISIAGAQEKTGLLWHNGQWHRPLGATPTTHILKLPLGQSRAGIDLSTSVENEWCCAQILKAFGLPTAHCEMQRFGRHKVLVVERFDRQLSPDGKWWQRLPQEDFCQATGTSPALKYESDGGPGIQKIMEILLGSQDAHTDRLKFLKTQILFWLLAAIDGHAKNFSLHLLQRGRFQLTPSYDVMSAYPVLGTSAGKLSPKKIKMAMSLSGKNRHYHHHEIQLRHFVSTFHEAGLATSAIQEPIHAVAAQADQVIGTVSALPIPADFKHHAIASILSHFQEATKRLQEAH